MELSPEQKLYLAHRVRGLTDVRAAQKSKYPLSAAREWENSPAFAEAFDAALEVLHSDRKEALKPLVAKAISVLEESLGGEAKIARDAAEYILNQFYGKPPSRTELSGSKDKPIRVIVESAIPRPSPVEEE